MLTIGVVSVNSLMYSLSFLSLVVDYCFYAGLDADLTLSAVFLLWPSKNVSQFLLFIFSSLIVMYQLSFMYTTVSGRTQRASFTQGIIKYVYHVPLLRIVFCT